MAQGVQFEGHGLVVVGLFGGVDTGTFADDQGVAVKWARARVMDARHGALIEFSVPDAATFRSVEPGAEVRVTLSQTKSGKLRFVALG